MSDTSIRTPAWGVTENVLLRQQLLYISIRTPTWGVTVGDNSDTICIPISIRTPAWGVTRCALFFDGNIVFQFAPPRGG